LPRFCIIIPSSNSAATLGEAVQSALDQDYADYSVVVSDNASSDGTAEIMSRFSHRRLRFLRHSAKVNKTENWRRAYALAEDCDYLVNLHSDDRLDAACLQALTRWFGQRPALLHGAFRRISPLGEPRPGRARFPLAHSTSGIAAKEILLLGNIVGVVGAAIRADAYAALGGWPERYSFFQDIEMWYSLAGVGKIVYLPEVLGSYRDAPATSSASAGNICEALDWHGERARLEPSVRLRRAALRALGDHATGAGDAIANLSVGERDRVLPALAVARAILAENRVPAFNRLFRQRWLRGRAAMAALITREFR